jgi:tellurite resistance-related uncharacterized protein
MAELPGDVVAYRRTPEFDERTLPTALQREHTTKAGAWALINVLEGKLLYRVLDPPSETMLEPGKPGVVRPQQPHEVQLVGPVRVYVEFYAKPRMSGAG